MGDTVAKGHQSVSQEDVAEDEKENTQHPVQSLTMDRSDAIDDRSVGEHRRNGSEAQCEQGDSAGNR